MTARSFCAWCGNFRPDTQRAGAWIHAACIPLADAYERRQDRGAPRVVPASSIPPQRASGYMPTGGRGARPVDAVFASRRVVPDDVPTADVIDGVTRGRGGRR